MSDLFGSLSIAVRSLLAQEGALDTTTNNISNVNTPGSSRQVPILSEAAPLDNGQISMGNGVDFKGVQSVRDNVLELRIDQETQQQNQLQTYVSSMDQVQSLFSDTEGSGISDAVNQFFSSFQELADNPTDTSTRQSVIAAGQNLAAAFQQTGQQLTSLRGGLDQQVSQTVSEINSDASQLASLNLQVSSAGSNTEQAGMIEDQQYSLLNDLSQFVDVAVTRTNNGSLTITTSDGVPLVAGNQSFALSTQVNPSTGYQDVYSQVNDVTAEFTGGQLAGLLQARDDAIPAIQSNLDNLAAGIISAVNLQNQKGYNLNGVKGGNLFQPVVQSSSGSNAGAAENMAMATTDPSQIAASADGTSGDNAKALALANIATLAIVNGQTATTFYSNIVSQVGTDVESAQDEEESVGLVITQLQNQRSNTSGVSLDEEAANLIQYQRAYEAAAEVVSAINNISNDFLTVIEVS